MSTVKGCVNTRNNMIKLMFPINATQFSTSQLWKIVNSWEWKGFYLVRVVVPTLLSVPKPGGLQKISTKSFKWILFKNRRDSETINSCSLWCILRTKYNRKWCHVSYCCRCVIVELSDDMLDCSRFNGNSDAALSPLSINKPLTGSSLVHDCRQ